MSADQPLVLPTGYEVATLERRIGARFLEGALGLVGIAVLAVLCYLVAGPDGIIAAYLLYGLGSLGLQLATGATLGQLALGLRNLDLTTGRPSGPRTLGKYLLMGLLGQVTCCIAWIVALATIQEPGRRTYFDRWLGVVVVRRVPGQAAGAPVLPPPYDATVDGPARLAPPPMAPAAVVPTAAVATPAPPPAAAVPVLRLDDGTTVRLDRPYVFGRDPAAPERFPAATPHPVVDVDRSLSKTHLLVGPSGDGALVIDLHSTNGVSVTEPGGSARRLSPGEPTRVPAGTEVRFGRRTLAVGP